MHRVTNNIEFNFLLFGFMANFIWEMLQMPFFIFSPEASMVDINNACIQASIGDAVMLVLMFWISTALLKSRNWIFSLSTKRVGLFLLPGIVMTVVFEALATGVFNRWTYGDLMPTLAFFGTGIVPLLQWFVVPLFVLWVVRRQLTVPIKP
ncbi:MAG: hypothetical protein GQ548_03065 [Methylophaga sp.]|nr:hypothetical protein [Methylophaga sp.]